MKRRNVVLTILSAVLVLSGTLWALPTTPYEAEMVVTGWLKANPRPLGTAVGQEVATIETFTDDFGVPAYHIVYLHPSGFVIVSADDMVEPIIGFADDGIYDPASGKPLAALVTNDLNGRIAGVRNTFSPLAMPAQMAVTESQKKWNYLIGLAATASDGFALMGESAIEDDNLSDVRVAPLIKSKWGQRGCNGDDSESPACYNYYTPQQNVNYSISFIEGDKNNYPCGCVATAMAQLMRYRQYPQEPVELKEFTIAVDERTMTRQLIRGEGPDGAYNWNDMVLSPVNNTPDKQRRAIGALCHDAGISVGMMYTADGSGALLHDAATALVDTFRYSNAILGESGENVGTRKELLEMINPNLDAGLPVIFGIRNSSYSYGGHSPVCDGYGYNTSTLYHHLNMGWDGRNDCWYNLPDVGGYDVITGCIYNVFTDGRGEIISGRVIDGDGKPIRDAVVTAQSDNDGVLYTAGTNSEGIYALTSVASDSTYTVTVDKFGYDFEPNTGYDKVVTERSSEGSYYSGNRWGVDFRGYSNCEPVTIGTEALNWDYPMHTKHRAGRTQVIYLANEIGRGGTVSGLALNVTQVPEQKMESWTIRIKHTGVSEYKTCALGAAGWTVVYRRDEEITGAGWQTFDFQTPFEYNGTDNLLVDFSHNGSSQSQDGVCKVSVPGGARSVYAYADSGYGDPLNWSGTTSPTTYCSDNVPNVKLTFCDDSEVVGGNIKLTASDGRGGDHFGCSVSVSGDYAIVGAYGGDENRGSAYVFKREGASWTEQAKLRVAGEDRFGFSVAISGDYAIVGAGSTQNDRDPGGSFSAHMFKRNGTSWTRQIRLNTLDTGRGSGFGCSVSISGDHAVVGSPSDDRVADDGKSGMDYTGSVCVFERNDASWLLSTKLYASDASKNAKFGSLVSISGDYVIAARDISGRWGKAYGSVYIFERDGMAWAEQTKLTTPAGLALDRFGNSIAISEDWAIIGAPEGDGNKELSGVVYLYNREGTSWTRQTGLTALDGDSADLFGNSVAISGNYIIIGAADDDDYYIGNNSGSAYVFKCDGATWAQQAKLTALDGAAGDHFGRSVSIDDNYAVVGAEDDDDKGRDSGAVYIFKRIGSTWMP